ncbi:MAG TPA: phosphoribosyltransferase family protein [Thermoanaerobaculia bacterium]|nr:phosphoribosyltransferase family protein [Thermoanaerobaculia bacterium]
MFIDRKDAGRALAEKLSRYAGRADVVVLGLPRGGVPVAAEVARALAAPLDVFVVRKIGLPGNPELAMGAIASGGVTVLSTDLIARLRVPPAAVEETIAREREELARRERSYRGGRGAPDLAGRTVLLVDDGLATGATMRAAVASVRKLRPRAIVVAVPVASPSACADAAAEADACVCLATPPDFTAVGEWYVDFGQTTDEEVRALLSAASPEAQAPGPR